MNHEQFIFPPEIHCRAGVFALEEWTREYPGPERGTTIKVTHRSYDGVSRASVRCTSVSVDAKGFHVSILLPDSGIENAVALIRLIESCWDSIMGRLDAVLDESLPVIDEAIGRFWGIPDEAPPTAKQLLATSVLRGLQLSLDSSEHTLFMFDRGDLIGGHDILLHLHPDGSPSHAGFDG